MRNSFSKVTISISLFSIEETEVDLRCGFIATTVWDKNGDGEVDYEDQVSVDQSVGKFPLTP